MKMKVKKKQNKRSSADLQKLANSQPNSRAGQNAQRVLNERGASS